MLNILILLATVALVLVACTDGSSSDPRVDEIVAQYKRLNVTDQEVDEFRQSIDDALDVLPAGEHDDYLDTLLESTKASADAVKEVNR